MASSIHRTLGWSDKLDSRCLYSSFKLKKYWPTVSFKNRKEHKYFVTSCVIKETLKTCLENLESIAWMNELGSKGNLIFKSQNWFKGTNHIF